MASIEPQNNLISSLENNGTRVVIASHFSKFSNDSSKTSSNQQEQTVPEKGGKEKVLPLHFGSTTRKLEFLEEFERRAAKKKATKQAREKAVEDARVAEEAKRAEEAKKAEPGEEANFNMEDYYEIKGSWYLKKANVKKKKKKKKKKQTLNEPKYTQKKKTEELPEAKNAKFMSIGPTLKSML